MPAYGWLPRLCFPVKLIDMNLRSSLLAPNLDCRELSTWVAWLDQLPIGPLTEEHTQHLYDRACDAALQGDLPLMASLTVRANLKIKGSRPFGIAASRNDLPMVQLILPASNPFARRSYGVLAAAKRGHITMMRWLLEQGAVDEVNSGSCILIHAVEGKQSECLQELLSRWPTTNCDGAFLRAVEARDQHLQSLLGPRVDLLAAAIKLGEQQRWGDLDELAQHWLTAPQQDQWINRSPDGALPHTQLQAKARSRAKILQETSTKSGRARPRS